MKGLRPHRPFPGDPHQEPPDNGAGEFLPIITTADLQARCMTPAALALKQSTPMFTSPVVEPA